MSGNANQTSTQIESELLDEMNRELKRRGSTVIRRKPEPDEDLLGSFAVTAMITCLAVLAGTGAAMALVYTPSVEDASASTAWFQQGALGEIVRGIHYHASNLLILLGAAYLGYMAWRGLYRRPFHRRWWRASLMLLLALGFSFTGMLLPYDQLAVHGTDIRLGYVAEVPVIGEPLRGMLQGGEQIGTATLSRFFGLHVILLPAFTLVLLRWLWKDGRAGGGFGAQLGVAGAVAGLLVLVALLFSAPLGLTGTLNEPYPEARPEWYALPLYAIMKVAQPGAGTVAALVLPPLLGAATVIALPLVDAAAENPSRFLKPLRIGLIATAVAMAGLAAWPLYGDYSAAEGYFKQHDVEDIMTQMGTRNDRLRNSAEPLPGDAHNLAHDLSLLFKRLDGHYPEDIKGNPGEDWDRWVRDGRESTRALWLAGDAEAQVKARRAIRKACQGCHDAQEKEDIPLDPPPLGSSPEPEPEPEYFFNADRLKTLQPLQLEREDSTSKVMDAMKVRMRDILAHAGASDAPPANDREQALIDLQFLARLVTTRLYPRNEGAYFYPEKWAEWSSELASALDDLEQAESREDVASMLGAAGKACDACHEGADDPTEPIEWRYRSLLR